MVPGLIVQQLQVQYAHSSVERTTHFENHVPCLAHLTYGCCFIIHVATYNVNEEFVVAVFQAVCAKKKYLSLVMSFCILLKNVDAVHSQMFKHL